MVSHIQAEAAIKVLKSMIEAAENSNQAGEDAVVAAAAGPTMLSALKTADLFLTHMANTWEVCAHTQAMMSDVKAAIAKAEGGQS